MKTNSKKVVTKLKQIEGWFNKQFAWFFTNGMKEIEDHSEKKEWRIIIPHVSEI